MGFRVGESLELADIQVEMRSALCAIGMLRRWATVAKNLVRRSPGCASGRNDVPTEWPAQSGGDR